LTACWLKGGEACLAAKGKSKYHAVFAAGPCHIVHPSDPAVALVALDARVTVVGPQGTRRLPIEDLFRTPQQGAWSESILEANELITGIVVPDPPSGARGAYVKVAERAVWDFALVSAAVQLVFGEGLGVPSRHAQARIVLGGVAPQPHRVPAAEEALMGQALTRETIERAAEAAASGAQPLSQNGYKVDLIRGVVAEALRRLYFSG
jgi:xanthine dehydrogenase YagS FAD-binding subunit